MEYSPHMPSLSRSLKLKVSQANRGGRGLNSESLAEIGGVERVRGGAKPKSEKFGQLGVVGGKLGWAEGGGEPNETG